MYGTCVTSMPARCLKSSSARCPEVPLPAEANAILPGRLLASATSSETEAAGTEGCTIRIFGTEMPCVIAVKSRSGW
ncbi:hypothetical protein D3C83_184970 [compost metagenome]